MTNSSDLYPDFVRADDPDLQRIITDLDDTYSSLTLPPQRDAMISKALAAARDTRPSVSPRRLSAIRFRGRNRVLSTGLAAAVVLGAGGAYLHGQGATAVSAQTVLQRATTAGISATTAAHSVYRLSTGSGQTGTGDIWLEADASGSPVALALTQSMSKDGKSRPRISFRNVQIGGTIQSYDAAHNTVRSYPADSSARKLVAMFDGPFIALHLSQLASKDGLRLLPAGTLDGAKVDVLQATTGGAINTFYFDAHTYVLRGVDWTSDGMVWHARLASYATIRLASVPANALSVNAPANARVVGQDHGGSMDFLSLFAGICNSTAQAVLADMQAHRDATGLEICRDTDPGISSSQLISALEGRDTTTRAATKMAYFVSTPVRNLRILNP